MVFRTELKLDLAQLLLADIRSVLLRLIRSYEKLTSRVESKQFESTANRRDFVYNMLLTLASPEDDTDQQVDQETKDELKAKISKNYRGTC